MTRAETYDYFITRGVYVGLKKVLSIIRVCLYTAVFFFLPILLWIHYWPDIGKFIERHVVGTNVNVASIMLTIIFFLLMLLIYVQMLMWSKKINSAILAPLKNKILNSTGNIDNTVKKVGNSLIMDFSMDLFDEENYVDDVVKSADYGEVNEFTLVPGTGKLLGLDISETSPGICTYIDSVKDTKNLHIKDDKNSPFREVILRRKLKSALVNLVGGITFDLIIVEDAYEGINPQTTRLLYALNTAIDELILDGLVGCKTFIRANNKEWKKWLFSVDVGGSTRGMSDKDRIAACLAMLGVHEEGKGFQDRLDACGMILGYLLCKDEIDKKQKAKYKKRIFMSDVVVSYEEDMDLAVEPARGDEGLEKFLVDDTRWSKEKIIDYLTINPEMVYVTSKPVRLGRLADDLFLPYVDNGGYLAFWIKPNKVKKYVSD